MDVLKVSYIAITVGKITLAKCYTEKNTLNEYNWPGTSTVGSLSSYK